MRPVSRLLLCALAAAAAIVPQTAPLTISTSSPLPAGTVGNPYALTFTGSGGAPPYAWGLSGGSLPSGLSLSNNGALSGVPTTPGVSNFIIQLNALGVTPPGSASKAFTLRIAAPLAISTSSPIPATAGAPLGPFILLATGGGPPYLWFVAPGSTLPPWLTLEASSGFLSGTPPTAGTFNFTLQVTDSLQGSASKALSIVVAPPMAISTPSPAPAGSAGVNYSLTFEATGGNAPYTWGIDSGVFPAGLTLNPATGALSGSPFAAGVYSFVVRVTDAVKATVTKSIALTVGGTSTGGASALLSTPSLDFAGLAGGDAPAPQSFSLISTGEALRFTVQTDNGADGSPSPAWVTVRPLRGTTPARISVSVDHGGFRSGTYLARVLVNTSDGKQSIVVVHLTVLEADPHLDVSPEYLRFSGPPGSAAPLDQSLLVRNIGGSGPTPFNASVLEGGSWLSLANPTGQVGPNAHALVRVIVNTQGLPRGPLRGLIRFTGPGGPVNVPVSLLVRDVAPVIGLNLNGLRFEARGRNGNSNTRNVNILNAGQGTVNWRADIVTDSPWLSLGAAGGTSTPQAPARLPLSADPGDLNPGAYYAVVRITDPAAANSPQFLTVVLSVADEGSAAKPDPSPSGLFFLGKVGAPAPAAQQVRIFTSSRAAVNFQASANTSDGGSWLSVDSAAGTASTASPGQVNVTANPAGLPAGRYSGDVTFAFSSTDVRTTNITLIVQPATAASAAKERAVAGCTPSQLSLTQTGLVNNFAAPAGWPTPLIVRLADDCGDPVLNGQVVATFSNGDPAQQMKLTVPDNGLYSATWSPGGPSSTVTVTARASSPALQSTTADITGAVTPQKVPVLFPNRVVANLNSRNGAPLASGMVAQVFGSALAPSRAEPGVVPLPKSFNGTRVLVGGLEAPLYFLSDGQLNVQIPTELAADKEYSIYVEANGGYTLSDTILLAPTQPGVVAFADGRLVAQHSDAVASLVSADSPARQGEVITLYLVGMGETDPLVATAAPSPGVEPLARVKSAPTVTIGGKMAPVIYSGLTPFAVGLYQITLTVPNGISGADLPVIITQNGVEANDTTLPVR